ncbi:MAG: DUF1552 domain-containing protein [Pseudobdellovibrionaceae bacterium]
MSSKKLKYMNRHLSRRQFLMGSGSSFLCLPPLVSLMSDFAMAQVLAPKRRFIAMIGLCGIDPYQIFPPNQSDLTAAPNALSTYYKPLKNFTAPISRLIDSDFVSIYPKMNLLQGLSMTGGLYQGHNITVLAGTHSQGGAPTFGRTIDVMMEKSPNVYAATDPVPIKAARVVCGPDHDNAFTFDTPGGKVTYSDALQGDVNLFNFLFARFSQSAPSTPSDDKLIVDKVYDDLKLLQSNKRISANDKTILDQFISSIFDLQTKINTATPPTCQKPSLALQAYGAAYYLPDYPGWKITDVSAMYDNYIELIKLAFVCDLTRVVFIGNQRCNSDLPEFLAIHHDAPSSDAAADRQKWGLKKFLKLAKTLDGVADPSGGGTLLDNSGLLFTNELGDWTGGHNVFSMPAVTFGSCGGYFKTGYFVDYRQRPLVDWFNVGHSPGRPYKQLLQSFMTAMGIPKSEYMQYGDGNGYGEFQPGINQFGKVSSTVFSAYAAEHNDPLPFIKMI